MRGGRRSKAPVQQFLLAASILAAVACGGGENELILGATTSVQDPGLLDVVVEAFEDETGYDVKPVPGGSGQILEQARRGEFDVIITHSPSDEAGFVGEGHGIESRKVMQNYFLVAGPADDPAAVHSADSMGEVFRLIAESGADFLSRGDNSGTHRRETAIWREIGIDPTGEEWYRESATSQGQSLLIASDSGAYTLVDSSTFTAFHDRVELVSLIKDVQNPNVYRVTLVNPERHDINEEGARALVEFLTGTEGQQLIGEFGRDEYGEPLFQPLAGGSTPP